MPELLFEINYQLCKEFPALTPFQLDDMFFVDVIALYCDVRTLQIRQDRKRQLKKNGKQVIRRPAGDDWF